jgi:beta-lactamase class A
LRARAASSSQPRNACIAGDTGPAGWEVGDKTGAGERGTNNDIGILLPPGRAPILAAIYLTQTAMSLAQSNQSIAAVGALIANPTPTLRRAEAGKAPFRQGVRRLLPKSGKSCYNY